jgi:hypothetical protein
MRDKERLLVKGPLGLWNFPLLNIILSLILSDGSVSGAGYQNEETITWVDWRGRERKIVIHRKAEAM